ncbi:MAG: DUF4430 domain-containing protein [Ruminococcaceae bacterium]|nr:DUF4430 domain-containing protein [Oscillospiraceae bacterium]
MKRNLKRIIMLLLAVVLCGSCTVSVLAEDKISAETVDVLLDELLQYELKTAGAESVDSWIEGKLAENAGGGSEWYIIALSRMGKEYDFSAYAEALKSKIAQKDISNAVERQRCALALTLAGYCSEYIEQTAVETTGTQGIMSIVFALHMMNNGIREELQTETQQKLLGLQLADGGWALRGETADVDITAMAIQALAPGRDDAEISSAIEKALVLLSERQLDNGGFTSYGVENPESAAQVIMALCALEIDCFQDERFIKNGKTVPEAMLEFRLDDGGFEHEHGKGKNAIAQYQVFCAAVSLKAGALYLAESAPVKEITIEKATETDKEEISKQTGTSFLPAYKLWIGGGILLLCGVWCLVLLAKKKRGFKNYLTVLIAAAILLGVLFFVDIKSTGEFYSSTAVENPVGTVTVSISCESIADENRKEIPENGMILDKTEFEIAEGDSVYALLIRAAREKKIHTECSGSGELIYVSGIANIYEFDYGDLSGWLYTVNGESPSEGCASYILSDGDVVEWIYTVDMGKGIRAQE